MKSRFESAEESQVLQRVINRNIRNAAAWRIGAEIARRYPEEVFLLDAYPIQGVEYDCLRVARLDGAGYVEFNRNATGSAHRLVSGQDEDVWSAFLIEWLTVADRRQLVRRVSEWLGMPAVSGLPRTTSRMLAYRALAGFLQSHALDRYRWSVDGAAVVDDLSTRHIFGSS